MQFSAVIDQIYASALDEAEWESAMKGIAEFCDASATAYFAINPGTGSIEGNAVNVDPIFLNQYVSHYFRIDIRIPPALPQPCGSILTELSLVSKRTLEASEIYNDLLLPSGTPHFMFSWLRKRAELLETIALESTLERGPLSDYSNSQYQLLLPHIGRALDVRRRLNGLSLRQHACFQLLEGLPFGVLMLNALGEIVETTKRAQLMLGSTSVMKMRCRRLTAVDTRSDRRLQAAIGFAADLRPGSVRLGDSFRLSRQNDRSLVVTVVPVVSEVLGLTLSDIAVLVLLVEPGVTARPDSHALESALQLSPAEADLACRLFNGESLTEASRQLNRAASTCRTQLKSIYRRTGCRGQSELVKLIASVLVAGVLHGGLSAAERQHLSVIQTAS